MMIQFKICILLQHTLADVPVILDMNNIYNYIRKDVLRVLDYYPPASMVTDDFPECEELKYFVLPPENGGIVHKDVIRETLIVVDELSVPIKLGKNSKILELLEIENQHKWLEPKDKDISWKLGIPFNNTNLRECEARKIKQNAKDDDTLTFRDLFLPIDEYTLKRFDALQVAFMCRMYKSYGYYKGYAPEWISNYENKVFNCYPNFYANYLWELCNI